VRSAQVPVNLADLHNKLRCSIAPFYSFVMRLGDCRNMAKQLLNPNKPNEDKKVYSPFNHPEINSQLIHQC
jgi:hypothetical protein